MNRALLFLAVLASLVCLLGGGCAAFTNPVANGIPVCRVPPELLAGPVRNEMQTIPLTLLKQPPPDIYRLAADDVLGVYIEGVLPASDLKAGPSNPPVYFPSQIDPLGGGMQPAMGFPIPVRDDGTVSLPLVEPISVRGMSLSEATAAIRKAYLAAELIRPGRERIVVTRMQTRRSRVLVIRQEVGGFTAGGRGLVVSGSSVKRGTGHTVDLPAYENDVLNALTQSGGLPGLDDYSDIFVFRAAMNSRVVSTLESLQPGQSPQVGAGLAGPIIRIPTRVAPGAPLPFQPQDIVLETGDVVFLEARVLELFYTGGLLPAGEHVLPRDYDLDVVTAIMDVGGPIINGGSVPINITASSNLNRGIGSPSPSLLTVVRRTPGGGQVPIRVDLNRAMRDPRERIRVQPGDVLILQETPGEALVRYATQTLNFSIISEVFKTSRTTGTVIGVGP
jgi:protein involved in polysaccharide export with SLBB domain